MIEYIVTERSMLVTYTYGMFLIAASFVLFLLKVYCKFLPTENFGDCFGISCMNNGKLNLTTCFCNCPPGKTGLECEFDSRSEWPDDNFALPETVFGCPEPGVYSWRLLELILIVKKKFLKSKRQYWPELPHYRGPFHLRNVSLNFCFKERHQVGGFVDTWPEGNYCIYKQHPCPHGMEEDEINLDGYQMKDTSTTLGPIPFIDVVDNNETTFVRLNVCCKTSDKQVVETILPRSKPFMLLQAFRNKECQHVKGTEVKQDWFAFISNQNRDNQSDERPLQLYYRKSNANLTYCFYKNYDRSECINFIDHGASYRGRLNYTMDGLPCSHWKDIPGIEYSNILEKNYCRKTTYLAIMETGCYAKVGDQELLQHCELDYCHKLGDDRDILYKHYPNIAYHRPLLTNIEKATLEGLVNGLSWRGSEDPFPSMYIHRAYKPWVRIDLGAEYRIHGIIMYRANNKCMYPHKWTNIATWIHDRPYQFENFGANLCWEIEELLEVCNIEMICVQPLTGYYVTIQAYASALVDYIQPEGKETHFEEIEVYGEATKCGQYFGIGTGKLWRFQVDTTMNKMTQFYMFDEKAGEKADVVLNLDLLSITTIEGIALSFNYIKYLTVIIRHDVHEISDSSEKIEMELFIELSRREKVQIKYFQKKIFARFLEITFINSQRVGNILVRYDLIGCPKIFLRDPKCQDTSTIVGMSLERGTSMSGTQTRDIGTATNSTTCSRNCLDTEGCNQWSFFTEGREKMACGQKNAYKIKRSSVFDSGEKICFEGSAVANPCHFELNFTDPMYITSLYYPEAHPPNMKCSWKINFYMYKSVKVTYLTLNIPTPNQDKIKNGLENCVDFLSLGEKERSLAYRPHVILTHENASSFEQSVSYIERMKYLYINYISCMRKPFEDSKPGFSLRIEETDCTGCRNEPTTCRAQKFAENTICDTLRACGYLLSLNYLGKYHPNLMCRWSFMVSRLVKIEILHFDIPGGVDCSGDNFTILSGLSKYNPDFSNKGDWTVKGVYCNANRPRAVWYLETDFLVEFATDDSIAGTGFLLKWQENREEKQRATFRQVSMINDWAHVLAANGQDVERYARFFINQTQFHFCGRMKYNYQLFVEYPYKCYLRHDEFITKNQPVSWNKAYSKCNQLGGKLVAVSNSVEDAIVRSFTDLGVVNNSFIGLYRNHSSGMLYDTTGEKYMYMRWGFDNAVMSVEPNGFGLNNCLMLRDILQTSGTFSNSKWADVNCDEEFIALVVCERPIRMPWTIRFSRFTFEDLSRNGTGIQNNSNLFMCDNGEYIRQEFKCDMEKNCLDGSDEVACDYQACLSDKFYCGDDEPRCINVNLTCDSYRDCHNGADEIDCVYPECDYDQWMCLNGQCIPEFSKNDGVFDCMDKSDEIVDGFKWRIDIQKSDTTEQEFDTPSDNFIQIYSENGRSENIYLVKNSYTIDGPVLSIETMLNMTNPIKIRITHYDANGENRWYLERVTLYNEEYGTFKFECHCILPDPNNIWILFRDISVDSQVIGEPVSEMVTYTIKIRTGEGFEASTKNKVYMTLYGDTSDTGVVELKHPFGYNEETFQSAYTDVFTYETVGIGDIAMVKLYHFGPNILDTWFLDKISIHSSDTNETITTMAKKWIPNMVASPEFGMTLFIRDSIPDYVQKRSCSNNMFQCLDGSCIRKSFYCDQTVHCHGPFHEDEPMACSPRHLRQSCLEMLVYTNSQEDFFPILFKQSDEPFDIHCAYGEDDDNETVVSKVHSDLDHWVNVTVQELNITYSIGDEGIEILKANSHYCSQKIELECKHSIDEDVDQAVKFTDNRGNLFEPFAKGGKYCKKRHKCHCQKSTVEWMSLRYMEFLKERDIVITKKSMLPIRAVSLSLRRQQPTEIRVRISPLECFERITSDDRLVCNNGERYDSKYRCLFTDGNHGGLTGCRDFSHINDCEAFECPTGFVKCHAGYCIPLHFICNGESECMGNEDEKDCNVNNTCAGALRCRFSTICVASNNICDGSSDCPFNDDELLCGNSTKIIRSLTVEKSVKWDNHTFNEYAALATLNLSSKGIEKMGKYLFEGLANLLLLDLSFNKLTNLEENIFSDLSRLKKIDLQGNPDISVIDQGTFNGLASLEELELKNMKISVINTGTFEGLDSLRILNLSNNLISTLKGKAFSGLPMLKTLDLRGNEIIDFSKDVFFGLDSLKTLISDLYLLCCIKPYSVPDDQCFPTRNEFSSCDDLMRNEVLRAFVWIIGLIALSGNALALVYRFLQEKTSFQTGNGILLTNLCVADFLMGVYMIIIGSADSHFRGKYVWNDISWRNGVMCKLAGFLSFLSCEVSGVFLCLITIDRFVTIRFTLKRMGFNRRSAILTCLLFWGICIILAVVPLVGIPYFDKRFYTKSGVCLAHPLTTDKRGGWEYATAIFVFLNFFMFIFIAVGQFLIFREIQKVRIVIQGQQRDDVAIARKLSLVVMTNFLCWFPICIMGLIAMSNVVIDIEVYAWVAVFVLPLNSATNPIVYTLSSLFTSGIGEKVKNKLSQERNKGLTEDDEAKKLQDLYDQGVILLCKQQSSITLNKYLENFTLKSSDAAAITRKLAETLDFIHTLGFVIGPLTCEEVVLKLTSTGMIRRVSLVALPIYSAITDDVSSDIGNLGLVIKKMIAGYEYIDYKRKNSKMKPQTSFKEKVFKLFGPSISEY